MRPANESNDDVVETIKFTLFPSPFPSRWCNHARSIQKSINLMVHRVAHDRAFLQETLETIIKVDPFTRNLFRIYTKVNNDHKAQRKCLGIFRADYMLNSNLDALRQIEVNTIASSFGGLTCVIEDLHRYIVSKLNSTRLPDKYSIQAKTALAKGLIKAWLDYGKNDAIILFVVEKKVRNICDQKIIEDEIFNLQPNAVVKRRTFVELHSTCMMDEENILRVNGDEVAVVYYRTGYVPKDYDSGDSWEIRLKLELSKAIKCPPVNYQLAGSKKIQQVLAKKEMLQKYLSQYEGLDNVFQTFGNIYSLSKNEEGDRAIEMALKRPENYVLKPQREGGGNNYFGSDVAKKLMQISQNDQRDAYILMELVKPNPVTNYVCISGQKLRDMGSGKSKIISELGIFGVILADKDNVYYNEEAGLLLRSKFDETNETGISSGSGFIDFPFLF